MNFKKSINCFFILLDLLIDSLIIWSAFLFTNKNKSDILLVRLDAIGDFFLWLDQAKEYRKIYPEKKITLVANKSWAELAENLPYWDNIISVGIQKYRRNPFYRLKKNLEIGRCSFEVAINPTYSRILLLNDSVIHIANAKKKIGSTGDCSNIRSWQKKISDRWYTDLLLGYSEEPQMELVENANFFRKLGRLDFKADVPVYPLRSQLSDTVSEALPSQFYIIFPGAGVEYRRWSCENFVKIAKKVSEKSSFKPIICGGLDEKNLGTFLAQNIPAHGADLINQTNLTDLVELIRRAEFVIANETSAVHIAASVNTPSVCITGGGHFGRFVPYQTETSEQRVLPKVVYQRRKCFGCNWGRQCLDDKSDLSIVVPCIADISVEEVWSHVEKLLEELKK